MVVLNQLRKRALAFPEVEEAPHFEKTSFRVRKKIFATCNSEGTNATLKLSLEDQDVFTSMSQGAVQPVPNAWGKQGWTLFDLKKVPALLFYDALKVAYCGVAPKSLGERVR